MREVATELAVVYPMMYRAKKSGFSQILVFYLLKHIIYIDESAKTTDGFRPNPKVLGINSLDQLIIDRVSGVSF